LRHNNIVIRFLERVTMPAPVSAAECVHVDPESTHATTANAIIRELLASLNLVQKAASEKGGLLFLALPLTA
jgi:hypothetical protein